MIFPKVEKSNRRGRSRPDHVPKERGVRDRKFLTQTVNALLLIS
jgi:hypothetical protein